jgi:hypothetical protein
MLPHAPQFVVLLALSTSQPLAGLLSQSRNDPVHAWSWQAPLEHTALALARTQARPQAPQFAPLVLVFTSQPLLGLPSQSRKPALHTKEHPPAVQTAAAFAGAAQTLPQVPQLRGSVWVLVQLPAHSVSPEAQVARHTPAEQTCPAPQALLHAPQLARSLWVFTSQPLTALPSQLAKPVSQVVSWHAPLVHADAPLEKRQVKPQAPQLLTLVSAVSQPLPALPSQLPKLVLQAKPQVPDAQVALALLGAAHTLPQRPQCEVEVSVRTSQPSPPLELQSPKPD